MARARSSSPRTIRLDDWNLLRSFVAVVETGTLTRAAVELRMTQPSVGRHIRALERVTGETLFDRLPAGLAPTSRARALYATLGPMRDLARKAEGFVGMTAERVTGVVRITTSEAFGYHILPPMLTPLMQAEPLLEIELQVSQEMANLLRRDADIAVRFVRPDQDEVIAKRVGRIELGMFATVDYIARCGAPRSLAESNGHVMIGPDQRDSNHELRAAGIRIPASARFRFRTDAVLVRLAAIEAGMGIGPCLVPVAAARPHLRRVLAAEFSLPLEIWLCGHDDLKRSTRLRRVFDFLDTHLTAQFAAS